MEGAVPGFGNRAPLGPIIVPSPDRDMFSVRITSGGISFPESRPQSFVYSF